MILTNNRFGDIIMENTNFDKHYDVFHAFLGLDRMVKCLSPKTIVVYGTAPDCIFKPYKDIGIEIVSFESLFSKSRKQVTA